jgi:histidinol phosphatase-like PHP family hydrolase
MIWDLHFHSTNSDGNKTPRERIAQIDILDPERKGIWALTDHDRYSPDFVLPAREAGIRAVWATEVSARSDDLGISLHVTCYTPTLSEHIRKLVEGIVIGRGVKIRGQIAKLQAAGFPIDEEWFFSWIVSLKMSPDMASNWHIANYLWRNTASRSLSIQIVKHHTRVEIKDCETFMKECLRENGDYADIGYHQAPRYEPEITELSHIAKGEWALLSIAHPNFSFSKTLEKLWAKSSQARYSTFESHVVPPLVEAGIWNFEINALASPGWVDVIGRVTKKTGGIITFGSDNHGLSVKDPKHGVFGMQNPLLTDDMSWPMRERLGEMMRG